MRQALITTAMGWFLIVGNYDGGAPIIVDKYPTFEACDKAASQLSSFSFKRDCIPAADEFEKGAQP